MSARLVRCAIALVVVLPSAGVLRAQRPAGSICAEPARPCPGFAAHDLSFVLPRDELARSETRSSEFWAVILESGARCAIDDARRARVQARFATRKVFSGRFECDDESIVRYDGVRADRAFLAVHAGTHAQASALADSLRRSGAFRGANARLMRVVLVHP